MEGIQNNDVATLSLLGSGGLGGIGGWGGAGYHSLQNTANFAHDGSVLNSKIEANKDSNTVQHANILGQIESAADRARDAANRSIADQHFTSLTDKLNDNSRFITSEFNALSREQNENARRAAECCCDAKVLAVENQAKTDAGMATIIANQAADVRVQDAVSNAQQNAKLDAILAEGGRGNGGGRG